MSELKPVFEATMAKSQWRNLYIKVEITSPKHKAAQRWLAAAASELFDVAEVKIKAGGDLKAKPFVGDAGAQKVTLVLSQDAVLGIKYAVVASLNGTAAPDRGPSNLLERRDLLASCEGVGANGGLRKLVEKEAKLPEDEDLDEGAELEGMAKASNETPTVPLQ